MGLLRVEHGEKMFTSTALGQYTQRCRNFETHSWQQVGGKNDPGEGDDCQGQGGPGCSVTNLGMC